MEQSINTETPTSTVVNNKQKSENGLKIAVAIACTVAVCGIGFGIYGMIQSSQKDGQISTLNSEIAELRQSIKELENNISTNAKDDNNSSAQNDTQEETKKDYSSFIGTWRNNQTKNEVTIKNITDNEITFTWFLYRLTAVEDLTIPFKDGKGIFFCQGYDDKNFDGNRTEDEKYARKATMELTDDGINIIVENVNQIDANQTVLGEFDGSVYITPGTYTHPDKI